MRGEQILVTFGGWYQRTTLHLSELQGFLAHGVSRLKLNPEKLHALQKTLDLETVERKVGLFEYLDIKTKSGIHIKYFEDGLYTLSMHVSGEADIETAKKQIKEYFEKKFKVATDYIFSLGAPTPKILSNMKQEHPIVIGTVRRQRKKGTTKKAIAAYASMKGKGMSVHKQQDAIHIEVEPGKKKYLEELIETQIFFREFKDQLHKYLNIHRSIWEDISDIKEQKYIAGAKIGEHKLRLESYKKTIQLIRNRIEQMGSYINTRQSISNRVGIETTLRDLFSYRFEDLVDTLEYIKEIWKMTLDYVNAAVDALRDLQRKASFGGLKSIQALVTIGVLLSIFRYSNIPWDSYFSTTALITIGGLLLLGWLINYTIKRRLKTKRYRIQMTERIEDI